MDPTTAPDGTFTAILDELRAIRAVLERAAPQRHRRIRDDDRAVVLAVGAVVGDAAFSSAEVIAHARLDARLRQALERADCDGSPRALGRLFARAEGQDVAGVALERVGADRAGLVWRVTSLPHHGGPTAECFHHD